MKNNPNIYDDIYRLINIFDSSKLFIISFSILSITVGAFFAYSKPDLYESRTIMVSTSQNQGIGNSFDSYQGLASLAGLSLPSSVTNSETEAIEVMSTLNFFKNEFLPKVNKEDIMAVNNWVEDKNILIYNPNVFNQKTNNWVREATLRRGKEPSPQELHAKFISNNFSIHKDNKTGFVILDVKHQSPYISKTWSEILVKSINESFREDIKSRTELSINYLYSQLSETNIAETKQALASLLEKEMEKFLLLEANKDYVFKVIEPPVVEESSSEPNRALIISVFGFIGLLIALLFALIRNYFFVKN